MERPPAVDGGENLTINQRFPELAREIVRQLITQWGTAQLDSIPQSSGRINYARISGVPIETVLDTGGTRMLIAEGTIAYL